MAAYVEIIFDNADGRLSVDSDEVILRRSIGLKKDEFFLNRKRIQKNEVVSLLESAGFSKSNPYYIVQQGKVSNLCTMKDKDRLQLLKEVAGTTVYEERRSESIKLMEETGSKQKQIDDVLVYLEERLDELDREKDELREYEQLDKNRRALEFSLHDKELTKAGEQLSELESTREERRAQYQDLFQRVRASQDRITADEECVQVARSALDRQVQRRSGLQAELEALLQEKSETEVSLQEAVASDKAQSAELTQTQKSLAEVLKQMESKQSELAAIEPVYAQKSLALQEAKEELATVRARTEALYGKQGRGRQFATERERNGFLTEQINTLKATMASRKEVLKRQRSEVQKEGDQLKKEHSQLQKATDDNRVRADAVEQATRRIASLTTRRNDLQEERKAAWREAEAIQEQIQDAKREVDRGKQMLNITLPRHVTEALACVEKIATEKALVGYFGPIIDLLTLKNDGFRTAVEVAAGNSLFHVVVDTDKTAALLMKELERRKSGRLTFLPLNRLHVAPVEYPDTNDAKPLLEVAIDFSPKFEAAMRQVFSKKLIAKDMDVAAQYSRPFHLDCITRDGDIVGRKGGYEGGFRDERTSRIAAVHKIRDASLKLAELMQEQEAITKRCDDLEKSVNQCLRDLQTAVTERDHEREATQSVAKELELRLRRCVASQMVLEDRRKASDNIDSECLALQRQIDEYATEMRSPLVTNLSKPEQAELEQLEGRERSLLATVSSSAADLLTVTAEREALLADLKNNLSRRRSELQHRLSLLQSAVGEGDRENTELQFLYQQQKDIRTREKAVEKELETVDALLEKRRSEVAQHERHLDTARQEEAALRVSMQEEQQLQDKLLNKRTMLSTTQLQKQRAIQELGTLPRKELEEFRPLSEKQILSRLRDVNEQLKKYASVNRKALDQYLGFNAQREELVNRKLELDREAEAINELVQRLDLQKEEAILGTFNTVRQHFSEVFAELVPNGQGMLVMRTAADENESLGVEGQEGADSGGVEESKVVSPPESGDAAVLMGSLRGVQVRVSFSGTGQRLEMQQLSGGQKALVALALIFAIQRCDPAPFYLFDEIDQALDANYRAGVARLIQKQANSKEAPAQFITTTFRPELVTVANQCFGIALQNKVSNLYPLDKGDAEKFVVNLMEEEEAVGTVSAVPSFSRVQRQEEQYGENEEEGEDFVGEDEEDPQVEEEEEDRRKQRRVADTAPVKVSANRGRRRKVSGR